MEIYILMLSGLGIINNFIVNEFFVELMEMS